MTDIVFIAGFPKSGSTLLGDLLAAMWEAEHIGETQSLFWAVQSNRRSCSCGRPISECERWSHALSLTEHLFPGSQLDHLHRELQVHTGMPPQRPAFRSQHPVRLERIAALMGAILERISREEAKAPLIDSSNFPRYGELLASEPGLSLRIVHLVRDARAVINSRRRKGLERKLAGASAPRVLGSIGVDCLRWNKANKMADDLSRRISPSSFVLYEDLAADPIGQTARIAHEIGLKPRAEPRVQTDEEGAAMSFYASREHVLWGNRGARKGWVTISTDHRWQDELSLFEKNLVTALCGKRMRRYGYV